MLTRIIKEADVRRLKRLLDESQKIVVTTHMSPDGDAVGSSLAMAAMMTTLGKDVKVVLPDRPLANLMFLPGAKEMIDARQYPDFAAALIADADLIFALDYNELKRIGALAGAVAASDAHKVLIDHHLNPGDFADPVFSHPDQSSTCALLFRVFCRLELFNLIDRYAAECLLAGMMTDTGNFAYNANDPGIYRILAELMERGVDKNDLYNKLFNTNSLTRIRIMGFCQYARLHVLDEHRCAITTLSLQEARDFNYSKGDTEGLVNIPLSIPGIVYSIFLRQDEEDYIKVSMRSKGNFSVKELCERHFDGGGHLNASGGEIRDTLDNAMARILELLPEADKMLEDYSEF